MRRRHTHKANPGHSLLKYSTDAYGSHVSNYNQFVSLEMDQRRNILRHIGYIVQQYNADIC